MLNPCSGCQKAESYCKGVCRPCYMRSYRQKPKQKEQRTVYNRNHYQLNKDWYTRRNKVFNQVHRDTRLPKFKQWVASFRSSPEYSLYKSASDQARHKRLKQSTPPWVNLAEIRAFYSKRPEGYHVDHIVPINGKNVCGLTVPWNLQYLPALENLRKSNKC